MMFRILKSNELGAQETCLAVRVRFVIIKPDNIQPLPLRWLTSPDGFQ
ncbi:hypothetical protein HMPREF0307_00072 [Corynebacterium sp. DNF00584]|nr:hypothetical protein HMPREF0307_00072 [Corynebacterium sp. DNF00584]